MPVVASLHLHPVKSCRALSVAEASLDLFGLVGDRRYLVVDAGGQFLTQRTLPRLAFVGAHVAGEHLTLTAPDFEPLTLRASAPRDALGCTVTIWGDSVQAADMGSTAATWLTRLLDRPSRLVAMAGGYARPITKPTALTGDQAAFSDAFPLLVISEASLGDLNDRLDEPLPMNRFRPNIVVRDCPAYAEDSWIRIRIGAVVLRAAGPCGRCVVTTTDQDTLERSKEPLRTLAQYRRSPDGEVNFGQNYIHENKAGLLRVGMPVEILEARGP